MTELPETFTAKKHEHHLIKRTHGFKQDVALYKRTNVTHENPSPHYEVVIIGKQEAGERDLFGQTITYEAREVYPSDAQWGTLGFTFQKYHNAEARYDVLAKRSRRASSI